MSKKKDLEIFDFMLRYFMISMSDGMQKFMIDLVRLLFEKGVKVDLKDMSVIRSEHDVLFKENSFPMRNYLVYRLKK
jgi:hypothetical protein